MTDQSKFSAVIFDLDGLMLDTESISQPGWKRAVTELGYELNEDTFVDIMGMKLESIGEIYRGILGEDFPFEKANELRLVYMNEHFEKFGIELKAGLLELIEFLDEKEIPKAIATSSGRDFAMQKLGVSGLLDRFDTIVCPDEIENGKPAPDIFLQAAKRLEVTAEDCIVLEDSGNGVKAGHAAGMKVILVPDLKRPPKEIEQLAYRVFDSLHEVKTFLEGELTC